MKTYSRTFAKSAIISLMVGFAISGLMAQESQYPAFIQKDGVWHVQVKARSKDQLKVYVGKEATRPVQMPISGDYSYEDDLLIFSPSFPFRHGMSYRAVYADGPPVLCQIPRQVSTKPVVLEQIYPSTDTFPANILKLYLHFSQPMRQGIAYEHIQLQYANGEVASFPFLKLQPELWDESGRVLTLWFDPGRVKRALGPNEWLGPPLEEGKAYALNIDKGWTSTKGFPLERSVSKAFWVETADRQQAQLKDWIIHRPSAESREPLRIDFGESLDHTLAMKTITVFDEVENEITGEIQVSQKERHWQFHPVQEWKSGRYRIRIESRLEDLAGNNLNRLFDRDISKTGEEHTSDQTYYFLPLLIE